MSRTNRGGKGPGHEYWGRRSATGKELRDPGRFTKDQTHRKERREGKRESDVATDGEKDRSFPCECDCHENGAVHMVAYCHGRCPVCHIPYMWLDDHIKFQHPGYRDEQ